MKPYIDRPASAAPARKELLLYLGCNVLRTAHLVEMIAKVLRHAISPAVSASVTNWDPL